jgi:hypothetical protein
LPIFLKKFNKMRGNNSTGNPLPPVSDKLDPTKLYQENLDMCQDRFIIESLQIQGGQPTSYIQVLPGKKSCMDFSTLQIGKIFDVYIELHNFRTNKNCYRYLELP